MLNIFGILIISIVLLLCMYYLNGLEVNLKSPKVWLIILFYISMIVLGLKINNRPFKPIYNYIIYSLMSFLILENNFKKSFITTNVIYFLVFLIEIFMFILVLFIISIKLGTISLGQCIDIVNNVPLYSFVINITGSIMLVLITNDSKFKEIYQKIIGIMEKIRIKWVVTIVFTVVFVVFLTYLTICYSNSIILTIIMFILITLIIIYVSIKNFKVMSEYEETKSRYSSVENSLLEYEEMIDKYRVNNHENKNQLLTIQNMIKNKDKKVSEYIDNLVGTVYMTNEKIMMDVSKIPAGGLRATIHAKLNIMDNKKIKYNLDIDRKLRTVDIESISSNVKLKISNIVSIFIDNAIDEVENHIDKIVDIAMYIDDDKLVIEITNRFKNNFDPNRMFDKKYTTKQSGHGYGLPLAKELIESEKTLSNYYKIEDDVFTQVLEVKIKR